MVENDRDVSGQPICSHLLVETCITVSRTIAVFGDFECQELAGYPQRPLEFNSTLTVLENAESMYESRRNACMHHSQCRVVAEVWTGRPGCVDALFAHV